MAPGKDVRTTATMADFKEGDQLPAREEAVAVRRILTVPSKHNCPGCGHSFYWITLATHIEGCKAFKKVTKKVFICVCTEAFRTRQLALKHARICTTDPR